MAHPVSFLPWVIPKSQDCSHSSDKPVWDICHRQIYGFLPTLSKCHQRCPFPPGYPRILWLSTCWAPQFSPSHLGTGFWEVLYLLKQTSEKWAPLHLLELLLFFTITRADPTNASEACASHLFGTRAIDNNDPHPHHSPPHPSSLPPKKPSENLVLCKFIWIAMN